MEDIQTRVRSIMSKVFGVDEREISSESSQDTVKKWDSLGHMNLVVALEEEFGVTFKDEQVVELLNYPLICEVLRELGGR